MPRLPLLTWVSLNEASPILLRAFESKGSAEIERYLVDALREGTIRARGRCYSWCRSNLQLELSDVVWSHKVEFAWPSNRFAIDSDSYINPKHVFEDVEIHRGELLRWLGMDESDRDATGEEDRPPLGSLPRSASAESTVAVTHKSAVETTGMPGRPSAKSHILAELKRRAASGELLDGVGAEARALVLWWNSTKAPEAPAVAQTSTENIIRNDYRKLKAGKRPDTT